jgi:hypothetical protein
MRLKSLKAQWFDKSIPRIYVRMYLNLFNTLCLNIQHNNQPFAGLVINGLFARAVVFATKARVFHETTLLENRGKLGGGDEEVIHAINFTRSWLPRRMGYGEVKCIRMCLLKLLN